jgi:transcriptional regulator with XRE-family HTH domain
MTELLERIGHNVRRLREEKGWNQTELGYNAETSPSIISLIENGKRNPNTVTLAKIATALEVEPEALFAPKAPRRSSLEPSLLNGLEEERRSPIVVEAISDVAEKWHEAASRPDASLREISTAVDAALALGEALIERFGPPSAAGYSPEQSEVVRLAARLLDISKGGNERILGRGEEQQYTARKEQIREMTRRISA